MKLLGETHIWNSLYIKLLKYMAPQIEHLFIEWILTPFFEHWTNLNTFNLILLNSIINLWPLTIAQCDSNNTKILHYCNIQFQYCNMRKVLHYCNSFAIVNKLHKFQKNIEVLFCTTLYLLHTFSQYWLLHYGNRY